MNNLFCLSPYSLTRPLLAALTAACFVTPALAENPEGAWTGMLANQLKINVVITPSPEGKHQIRLHSPMQNDFRIDADSVEVSETSVKFGISQLQARYDAKWDEAKKAWVGTWTQGASLPLNLVRMLDDTQLKSPKRPQIEAIDSSTPNYIQTAVNIESVDGIRLSGTLSIPSGSGPGPRLFPAVVLVHGSGPLNRDQEIFGHAIFKLLADHLTRSGIAVLRYDKRGVGDSSGHYRFASTLDFADDAWAAVEFLKHQTSIDPRKIGIVGHSEGGLIAPIVATRHKELAFVVSLAGPSQKGGDILIDQYSNNAKVQGASEADIKKYVAIYTDLYRAIERMPQTETALTTVLQNNAAFQSLPSDERSSIAQTLAKPWFQNFIRMDPAIYWKNLQQPTLVLIGELDKQVFPKNHIPLFKDYLAKNPKASIHVLPKLNHLFQTAETGLTSEYGQIEETMAPSVLNQVSTWILKTTR